MAAKNYDELARKVLDHVGGAENITYAAHCMTRLRLNLRDKGKVDQDGVNAVKGVVSSLWSGDQYQIIIGATVNEAYDALCEVGHLEKHDEVQENLDEGPKEPLTVKSFFSGLLTILTECITPLLSAFIAMGMFATVKALFGPTGFGVVGEETGFYQLMDALQQGIMFYIPMMVAYTAAKKFNCTTVYAMSLVAFMLYPDFMNLITGGELSIFGLHVPAYAINGQSIPVIIEVWMLSHIEKFFTKHLPEQIRLPLVGMLSISVVVPFALFIINPAAMMLGNGFTVLLNGMYGYVGPLVTMLLGALWLVLIIPGMHAAVAGFFLLNFFNTGVDYVLLPSAMATVCFICAATNLGYFIKTKDKDQKELASSGIIAMLLGGVVEPSLYGIYLNHIHTFIASMLGMAVTGLYMGLMHVSCNSMASSNFLALGMYLSGGMDNLIKAVIGIAIGMAVAFVYSFMFGAKETKKKTQVKSAAAQTLPELNVSDNDIVALADGQQIDIATVSDPAFAQQMMGESIAFKYTGNKVMLCAPANGTLSVLFPTGHAFGLTMNNGVEILVHIGVNTVAANGDGFRMMGKEQGDSVKAGEPIVEVDLKKLGQKYDMSTMLIITDANGRNIAFTDPGPVKRGQPVVK